MLLFIVIYTIEFQKSGLPHAHILVFLAAWSKSMEVKTIDKFISAELPDKTTDPDLFDVVTSFMIHGPCGIEHPSSPCMQNGKCSKHFPKDFTSSTTIDKAGYPLYMRRRNGYVFQKGSVVIDNSFIVPYNRTLLLKYKAHINVEWCNQTRSVKYLFKYVNKGHDRVTTTFYNPPQDNNECQCLDEIKLYYDCRYLSSCESAWRIFSFDIHHREPSVERLNFHLPDEHYIVYESNKNIEDVLDRKSSHRTKFMAWMEANKEYAEAQNLTYFQFPLKFVWKDKDHRWVPRKKGFSIGRLHFVPPGTGEIYYLRMLLAYVKGPTSYEDIRTVDGRVRSTFKKACYARGLLHDDAEYNIAIKEASVWGTGDYLRRLFAVLLMSNQLSRPDFVWKKTWEFLSDDILYKQRRLLRFPGVFNLFCIYSFCLF